LGASRHERVGASRASEGNSCDHTRARRRRPGMGGPQIPTASTPQDLHCRRFLLAAAASGLLAALALPRPARAEQAPLPPTTQQCEAVRAHRSLAPILARDPRPHAPRVFAMQFKQNVTNVVTYEAFRIIGHDVGHVLLE